MPLDRADVDTDQIIPKQFLKRIERSGFGPFLFYDWKKDPAFVLVAGPNFGCGSSREHAPWAIEDAGFRVVIAPSFADIFRTNCDKVGILAVQLPEPRVRQLLDMAEEDPTVEVSVDLERQTVSAPGFVEAHFEIDQFTKECLLNGWDGVALTLRHQDAIAAYERKAGIPAR
jgi:3-isopropylmalate/(R)-2-methylmalate dehydratase small subunit